MTDVAATTTRGRATPTAGEPSPAQKVQQSAARAAEGVAGVHELGTPGGRALVRAMGRVPGGRTTYGPGVSVEVGESKAAVDVSLVVEFGSPAPAVADQVRGAVREQVRREAGLEVVEVNVTVVGLHHPDDDLPPEPEVDPAATAATGETAGAGEPQPDASTEDVREAGEEVQRIVARAVDEAVPDAEDRAPEQGSPSTVVIDAGSDGPGPDVVVADRVVVADSVVVVDGEQDQHDQQDQHEGDRPEDQAPPRHG